MSTFWINDKNLDEFQSAAVQNFSAEDSFLVRGPAGSGKTNILLLRAKWLRIKDVKNVKIVVFTASLKEHVQEGCATYSLPAGIVTTHMQLFKDLLGDYNVAFSLSDDFDSDRSMLAGAAKSLIDLRNIEPIYDALFVDECQDYMDTELMVFRRLARRLILVADSRQSIYRVTHTPELLEKLVGNKVITLKYHYRSGLNICVVADGILSDSVTYPRVTPDCKYDEAVRPSSVTPEECEDFETQIAQIMSALPGQLDLYPDELVGVVFPKKEQVERFRHVLDADKTISDKSRVRVQTMHGAKGLEFRAVHIAGCEALSKMGPTQKRLAYTSILRGRTAATIYYTGNIPGYLESALARLEPPKATPTLADLFRS